MAPRLFQSIALSLVFCVCATPQNAAPPGLNVGPYSLESAPWSEPYSGSEGVPKGARRAILGTDPRTNGVTYYAHFPAGTRFELHWHADAEYAVVLRGKLTHILDGKPSVLKPGDYIVVPARVPHGWEIPGPEDAYLLIRRDGPADLHFVDKTQPGNSPERGRER